MSYAANPATLQSLVQPHRIHSDVYTDPEIFDLEMKRLFGRAWLLVGHESQIKRPGDYFTTSLATRPVIVVRDTSGNVRILHNRCSHRGVHLCGRSHGTADGMRFMCPYHGWTFDLHGTLVGMPLRDQYGPSFSVADHALRAVPRVESYAGFIFASHSPEGEDLRTFLGGMRENLDNFIDRAPQGELEVLDQGIKYRYRANWKLVFENLNDILHPFYAHRSAANAIKTIDRERLHPLLRTFSTALPELTKLNSVTERFGHSYLQGVVAMGKTVPARDEYFDALAQRQGEQKAWDALALDRHITLLYPGGMLFPTSLNFRIVRPLSASLTEVHGFVLRAKGAPEEVVRNAIEYCNYAASPMSPVGIDDFEIYERAQRQYLSGADQWISLHRCADHDQNGGAIVGTSEAFIRNQYQAWLQYLCSNEVHA
jgi:phenylpropionate dioxygenase-like ring-hydroxylating dioxygenase large terminal subunit